MQDYINLAAKNGVTLKNIGDCQFCGAKTQRGIHECVEILSLGFQVLDYTSLENHLFRFISVDAHTLQHPEIHGRWNNHFHLTRQHLIFHYCIQWNYSLSPKLSEYLREYKSQKSEEYLKPPNKFQRGNITTTDVLKTSSNETECREMILKWGTEVYNSWSKHHEKVDRIAQEFIRRNKSHLSKKPIRNAD